MCSQHGILVQVVIVPFLATRMVLWNEQAVKILLHSYHRTQIVKNREEWVAPPPNVGTVEIRFNALLNKPERVMWPIVEVTSYFGQNFGRNISVFVTVIRLTQHLDILLDHGLSCQTIIAQTSEDAGTVDYCSFPCSDTVIDAVLVHRLSQERSKVGLMVHPHCEWIIEL